MLAGERFLFATARPEYQNPRRQQSWYPPSHKTQGRGTHRFMVSVIQRPRHPPPTVVMVSAIKAGPPARASFDVLKIPTVYAPTLLDCDLDGRGGAAIGIRGIEGVSRGL